MRWRPLGLRLRLTLVYALFCIAILAVLGVIFRQTLISQLKKNSADLLEEDWATMRAYLRFEKQKPEWYFDRKDEEETATVLRFRQGYLHIAGRTGNTLEISDKYRDLGPESEADITAAVAAAKPAIREHTDEYGYNYMIRSGVMLDDDKRPYYIAVGRSLDADAAVVDEFTNRYLYLAPGLLLGFGILSWIAAGRALRPLNDVVHAAQSITGHKLDLRLPRRGAGDELDHLIDSFNNMVDRLEASFNQIRRFTVDVSHELRTPLTSIRGQLEVALMTATSKEQYRDAMVAAVSDVDRLAQVVRALLHLSQAESGQVVVARDPLDLSAVTAAIADQFQYPAEAENLALESHMVPGMIVLGDKVQLERMISNLLSNAIKYTPAGGRITVSVRPQGSEVELAVADTGRGIPAEHLPHIFDRFYRVPDGSRDPDKGLGIGLSFVAWIVKAHGARIRVDSEPGKGSVFTVTFGPADPDSGDRISV
ncbi:MAG: heavy metal sensor histidine kinase [Acidobacteria bacterium]|nr:heavy metal sensor histidine kinase [Acidobacteriota bacterium]